MRYIANMHYDGDDDDAKVPKSVDCLLLFLNLIPWTESKALTGLYFLVEGSTEIHIVHLGVAFSTISCLCRNPTHI